MCMYILYIYIYIYISNGYAKWVYHGYIIIYNGYIHIYIYIIIYLYSIHVFFLCMCAHMYTVYIYIYVFIYIYACIYIYIYPMIPRPYLPWPRLYQKWTTINGFWRLYGEFSSTIPVSHLRLYRQNINAYTGTVAICGPKDPDVDCWKPQVV